MTTYICPHCNGEEGCQEFYEPDTCRQPCDEEKAYWEEKKWREQRENDREPT